MEASVRAPHSRTEVRRRAPIGAQIAATSAPARLAIGPAAA